jgi:hypothetical protein
MWDSTVSPLGSEFAQACHTQAGLRGIQFRMTLCCKGFSRLMTIVHVVLIFSDAPHSRYLTDIRTVGST